MSDTLIVLLDNAVAGTVTRLRGGRLRFEYDGDYVARPSTLPSTLPMSLATGPPAVPLSLSMPMQVRSHTDQVVTPWLWNLLPDNEAVLARWARQFHASASSPFSLLATPIGEDCAGAVQFVTHENVQEVMGRPSEVTWLTEGEVAQRLRELREDSTAWLGKSFTGQFSLAGAQAKTALLYQDGHWGVPHGSAATSHILKPAVAGFDDHDLNEHLCLDAARRAGLIVARTRVARFEDQTAIVVDRYDRRLSNGQMVRIHQEDLCQALGVPPSKKYQNEGGPGAKDIAGLLRRVMAPRVATDAVSRFADALIWNWIIAGTDAHAKNYSLLLASDQVRLAPLYDIASALPYGMHERKLRFAMKIGGDYRVFLYRGTWPAAAKDLGMNPDQLRARARQLAIAAPDAFSDAAAVPDITDLDRDLPKQLVDLVAERAARCVKLLDSDSASSTLVALSPPPPATIGTDGSE
jgi:serine/threonine-protein kinase HipA